MELILSSGALTLLLLVGGIVEFLTTASAPRAVRHSDAFSVVPNPLRLVEQPLQFAPEPEYDRAA